MLISPVAVAALLIVMVTMLDAGNSELILITCFACDWLSSADIPFLFSVILKDAHYMLFYLTPAIQPRMLVTFDEELNPLPVTVRVGQVREGEGEGGGRYNAKHHPWDPAVVPCSNITSSHRLWMLWGRQGSQRASQDFRPT